MHRRGNILFVAAISAVFLLLWLDPDAGVHGQTTDFPGDSCICLQGNHVYESDCSDTNVLESKCYAYTGNRQNCSSENYYEVIMNGSVKLIRDPVLSPTIKWAGYENCRNCSPMCPNDPGEVLLYIECDCKHYCECRNGTGYIRPCPPIVDPRIWICVDPTYLSPSILACCTNSSMTTLPYSTAQQTTSP